MGTLYISEYDELPRDASSLRVYIPKEPAITRQVFTYSSTGPVDSSALSNTTRFISIHASSGCWVEIGTTSPVAGSTSGRPLPADTDIFVGVTPGDLISVVGS